MTQFQFQFQYGPSDLKIIRDESGVVRFSPAASISVWATGFAICLMILGALDQWNILMALLFVAMIVLSWFVRRLNRVGMADREYLVRTITISDSGVVEEFANSMFEKSWSAFDDFIDAPGHLLLKHYEKVTAIPKRSIPPEELEACITYMHSKLNSRLNDEVDKFSQWFENECRFGKYSFRWSDTDIQLLQKEKMQLFRSVESDSSGRGRRSPILATFLILIAIGFLMLYFEFFNIGGPPHWDQVALFAFALGLPFALALMWWKYTKNLVQQKKPKIPDEEIQVTLSEEDLMIGYPKAVARYSLQDIVAFYHSERFIGFRPPTGMIHVIANHAFGGRPEAMAFLKLADSLRRSGAAEIAGDDVVAEVVETGNPFQPPIHLD